MIDVKEAARVATAYLTDLFSSADPSSVRLEEVEVTEDERYWLITLSFREAYEPVRNLLSPSDMSGRQYKVFKVDAETGKVLSVKIRQLEGA